VNVAGERESVCTGCGTGAIAGCVGAGTEVDVGAGTGAETGAAVETAPVLNDKYLSATDLPERIRGTWLRRGGRKVKRKA